LCNAKAKKRNPNPNNSKIPISNSNPNVPKALTPPNPIFNISTQYVSGDIKEVGSVLMGIKSGLINNSGNFMRICKTIVLPGLLDGGAEIIRLKLENTKLVRIIANKIRIILKPNWFDKKIMPKTNGIDEKIIPYMNELQILPNTIVLIEIGHVIKRSNVPRIVSHGRIIGPIEVEVRKRTIVINPDIR